MSEMDMPDDTTSTRAMQNIFQKIDSGFHLADESIMKEGIEEGEKLLPTLSEKKEIVTLHYKLENAYADFFDLYERDKGIKLIPLSENLQKQKRHLREALSYIDGLDPYVEKQLCVNLGNCLDTLGRGVEAFDAYDEALRIDPKFAMAIGNKAITSRYFASITGKFTNAIYIDAYQAIQSIIDDEQLEKIGGIGTKQRFESVLRATEERVTDKKILQQPSKHSHYDASNLSHFEKFYIDFCIKNKLFLNFHIHDNTCEAAISDPIFISITTDINDETTFYDLSRYINQIKEDYAVARLLLVQSRFARKDFNNISERTTFINPLDYSQSNIYNGLLKSAFKEAYNILDKISLFLNKYYNLNMKENSIYFDSIWVKNKRKDQSIREEILDAENISLYALYDIYKDFQRGHFKKLKDIRNALTHRQLTIFSEWGMVKNNNDNEMVGIGSDEMLGQTVQLMRLVKAAIIYLINAVTIEESKKKISGKSSIVISADTSQFLRKPPEK